MLVLIFLTIIWYVPKDNIHFNRLLRLKYWKYSHKTVFAEVVNPAVITVHTTYIHQICWRLLPAVISVWMRQVTELQGARHRVNLVHSDHCDEPQFSHYTYWTRYSGYISDGLMWYRRYKGCIYNAWTNYGSESPTTKQEIYFINLIPQMFTFWHMGPTFARI